MGMDNVTHLLISTFCAIPGSVLALYFGFFVANPGVWLPISIDDHAEWHNPPSLTDSHLIHNFLLLLIFPIQHSLTLQGPLNSLINFILPEKYFRSVYALLAGLSLGVMMYFWQPMTTVVWEVKSATAANIITGMSVVGFLGVVVSMLSLDPLSLDIIGMKEPLWKLMGWKLQKEPTLIDTGLYALMRHPAYTMLMLGMWITAKMTVGHLLLDVVYTLYVVLAVKFSEEPALLKLLGNDYEDYMTRTPCFIPSFDVQRKTKRN